MLHDTHQLWMCWVGEILCLPCAQVHVGFEEHGANAILLMLPYIT